MNTLTKLQTVEHKLIWFVRNKSCAAYAMAELAECLKLVSEVKLRVQDAVPQFNDVLDGKAEIVYPHLTPSVSSPVEPGKSSTKTPEQ